MRDSTLCLDDPGSSSVDAPEVTSQPSLLHPPEDSPTMGELLQEVDDEGSEDEEEGTGDGEAKDVVGVCKM